MQQGGVFVHVGRGVEPSHPAPSRLRRALILGSLTAFAPLSIDMYLPALPRLSVNLGAPASLAQLSLTACLLGLALGQVLAGPISDAMGRRRPLLIGVAVYVLVSALCALSPSIWPLVVLRLIQGLAGATGIVVARAVVRDLYSGPELTKFYALLQLVSGAAPIVAPVLGGQLLRFTDWHGVFLVLAGIGALIWCAVAMGLPESLSVERRSVGGVRETFRAFGQLLTDRRFMGYALSAGLVSAGMFAYISGSPFVLQNVFGVSPQVFSAVFATNGIGIILSSQSAGLFASRVGERRLLRVGLGAAFTASLVLLGVLLGHAGLAAVLLPLFVVVASVGMVGTTTFALAMQSQGERAGKASALMGLPQMLSGALVAPLVGVRGSHAVAPMGLVIASCDVAAVACYLALVVASSRRRVLEEGLPGRY